MKLFLSLLVIITTSSIANASASETAEFLKKYYLSLIQPQATKFRSGEFNLLNQSNEILPFVRCPEPGPSCVSVVCSKGGFSCSSSSQLEHVAQACKGVDGNCVEAACAPGGINCSSSSQMDHVMDMCKQSRGSCIKAVCAQGGYSCSSSSQLDHVILACAQTSGSCVTDICKQGGFSCSSSSQLDRVIALCVDDGNNP